MAEMPQPAASDPAQLKFFFKHLLNPFMLALWRLGLGGWFRLYPRLSGNIMVLRHKGRKSGIQRYQPLNFALVDGDIYCLAAFGATADWYRNLLAHPATEVWLPDGRWAVIAEDANDAPARTTLVRAVLKGSGFAAYVAGLWPDRMSDAEIDHASHGYRLLRLRRQAPLTGPGGPGELAWLWPLIFVAWLTMCRRRRR